MKYENISDDLARRIIREIKPKAVITPKKKHFTKVSFHISGMHQHPITTTSTQDVLKFIFGELIQNIDKRSPAGIKGMIAEAGEWLAQIESNPMNRGKIRKFMSNMMLIKSRNNLIQAVGNFTASLTEKR